MIVEHNQSTYYKVPYPTTNTGSYDNAYKFNGKELDAATGMYYYGARYYDPRISIFISVDPLAEQFTGWTPYHYVHQNPINLIDPTGMSAEFIDGPGDEFTSLEEAAIDFGKEYNGLSIVHGIEIGTNFYESINPNGETFYSYTIPVAGGGGMVDIPNDLKEGQRIIAQGHTHGGDYDVTTRGKTEQTSSANRFSGQDIDLYNNKIKNKFDQPIQGFVITPNGGILHYDPEKTYMNVKVKGQLGLSPSYNLPINKSMPSDPASDTLRLNDISPDYVPKEAPLYFNSDIYPRRPGY